MASATSRVKRYVFDLDGTLFDTEQLVRRAYLAAGVNMPDDAWGKPAREWLPALKGPLWPNYHVRKNEIYNRMLIESPPQRTTAARAMVDLSTGGCETYLLTGASRPAVNLLMHGFQPYHFKTLGVGCTLDEKLHRVRVVGDPRQTVYVDDDENACAAFAELGCSVVCYDVGMSKEEVLRPWAQSSWQRDVARD